MADATIVRYEPCRTCVDGTCGACGPASGEHAAPGVCLVVRQIRFIRCPALSYNLDGVPSCKAGCNRCGPAVHPLAAVGTTVEVVDVRAAKRWVPSVHMRAVGGDAPRCGGVVPDARLTTKWSEVTCKLCLRRKGKSIR